MKSTKHLLFIILALISISINAQETVSLTINLETAGTLPDLIPSSRKYQITQLTLTGSINGTDIRYIREMSGNNAEYNTTDGKLSVLDISSVKIVSGGEFYIKLSGKQYYSSLDTIGDYTFMGCKKLTSVRIPNSVKSIGIGAFDGCQGLTSITIPNSVESINHSAFSGCSWLASITIPESVTTIGDNAFYGCARLTSVTIPNSVITIGESAFSNCTELRNITIPSSLTTIGDGSFASCTSLKEFIVSENNLAYKSIEGVLLSKDGTKLIAYPNSKSNTYTIPNSVITIGNRAFFSCDKLTSVTIPNSVTTIGDESFSRCSQIEKIYCKGTTPPNVNNNTFSDIYYTCKLYIPKGTYLAYWVAPVWSKFTNIFEQVTTSITDIEASKTNIYTENGSIVVKGGKLGDTVDIYSVSGSLLHKIKITDDIVRISVAPQSLYIVKTGDRSFKIAL